ncbi:SDR family oxidoreductase [Actinomadura soli]|uniref:SDR family oxidoreductase n=1 Tax=Actinomadura soli TaxID=2508997 RepID=A0A5C4J2H4_9ACTN|nr:SDR family oxidoreductase [Actinomadura soli]TMQ90965.1 SDR family oxidoreductase [Actinomadura soli]
MSTNQKTWFITGASRGIGRELAEQALRRGDRVAATVRNPAALDELRDTYGSRLWTARLDVTDDDAMREVVRKAFTELGRIDVVVSNAGYGLIGAAEEFTDAQVTAMISTNLTAGIQLARATTPYLREQGGGHFMQMSSMGGFITYTGFAMYHATKFGLEGFFQAWASEVEPFGIRTTLVEPGQIRTSFYESTQIAETSDPYRDHSSLWRGHVDLEAMPGDQAKVAAAMIDAADAATTPPRLLLGSDAFELVTNALTERLDYFKAHEAVSRSTDVDGFVPPGQQAS